MRIRDGLVLVAGKAKSLGALDLALRYNPVVRRQVKEAIRRCRTGDPRQRRECADRLLGMVIRRARLTRYGRQFGNSIRDWPILTKAQLRDDPPAFVAPGLLRVPAATGGTTGLPLALNRSLRCVAAEQVFLDNLLAPHGLSWGRARVAVLRGDAIKRVDDCDPPFGRETHRGRRLILSSPHLSAATLGWYLERLAAFKPDILFAYPTTLANILMLMSGSSRRLRVPLVVTSSECLDAALYQTVQQEMGAAIIDYYGLAERSAFAVRESENRWMFDPAYGKIELISSPADEITDGQRYVPIIATGYWNDAQPLIRYDTGDRAMVPVSADAAALEAIATGERPFFGIAGRSDEYVFTPDGRRIAGLNQVAREVQNVLRIQLVQEELDRIAIRVLVTPRFGSEDQAMVLGNARAKVPGSIAIDIQIVERLETTPRGKTPFIIRRVDAGRSTQPLIMP